MAVAHLLHGRRTEYRVVVLRAQRRQVAQELREVDPLLAEITHLKVVLGADVAEIALLRLRGRGHRRLELGRLPVTQVEADDAPLDDGAVEPKIGLVLAVVGRNLVVSEDRVDRAIDVVLVEFADQQRLTVLLDHAVDIVGRRGEELLGLLEFELLDHPTVDILAHEGRTVLTRKPLRHDRTQVAHAEFPVAGTGDGLVAGEIARQLPASDQQQGAHRDRYFRAQIHIPKGKDSLFTRN